MTTAATYIQEAESSWNNDLNTVTNFSSPSFTVAVGDVLVAVGALGDNLTSLTITNSNTAFEWTQRQVVAVSQFCYLSVWTTTAKAAQSMTVTMTRAGVPGNTLFAGMNVLTFRGSYGIGASAKANNASGAPTVSLTPIGVNSIIVMFAADWTALDGAARTYSTINGITPTASGALEFTYFRDAANYTVYGVYWNTTGAIAADAPGVTAPGAQKYSIVAVEVLGNSDVALKNRVSTLGQNKAIRPRVFAPGTSR